MESVLVQLPALLKLCVAVLIFAIGLGSSLGDLTYLGRRPGLLLRSLLAMYVLVPLVALAFAKLLPLDAGVKAALLVLAVSAGAPLLPRKLSKLGGGAYPFSLVVVSSLLAIVLVPAWVGLLGRHFGRDLDVSSATAATLIAKAFLAPLAAGMVLRLASPELCERASDLLMKIAGGVLTLAGLLLLAVNWRLLLQLQGPGMAALVALMIVALAIGHWLGGPTEDDRTALAIACATRHVGLAVLVAASFPGLRTVAVVAAYSVASLLVSIPYLAWRRRSEVATGDAQRGK
jgi:BASS family bile acid:Na+ symporter